MDLAAEAERLRLDLLAVEVSRALEVAGIPHVLLKGPSTSLWLYDPPRRYNDVDMLVPYSRVRDAVTALGSAGIAVPAGELGEEASHSQLLISHVGFEVDLHVTLPTAATYTDDRVWEVLSAHVEPLALDVGEVPALDEPARCLVLALHAVASGEQVPKSTEDLKRALDVASGDSWAAGRALAERLEVADFFDAGLVMAGRPISGRLSERAYLRVADAPNAAIAIDRLKATPLRQLPAALWREVLPSRGFMERAYAVTDSRSLRRAHLTRWRSIAAELPDAVRARRAAKRSQRQDAHGDEHTKAPHPRG